MSDREPPEGFSPHFRKSRVTDPWEPLYSRKVGNALQIGLWLSDAHCNSRGLVHGAVIAALADNAMGITYVMAVLGKDQKDRKIGAVTLNLNVDYASTASVDQWLQVEPRIIRAGTSVGFVDALVTAEEKIVARASASFKLVG